MMNKNFVVTLISLLLFVVLFMEALCEERYEKIEQEIDNIKEENIKLKNQIELYDEQFGVYPQ
jgi:F0F1-type ATP synthase membrane subunit b/b'|nr:MAG TPA: Maltoporin periplasmic N-terminal extension [Bacteriophage sp.]